MADAVGRDGAIGSPQYCGYLSFSYSLSALSKTC